MDELRNKRVTVLGLGRFGGGIATARWLCGEGAGVTVVDQDSLENLRDSVAQLEGLPIEYRLGKDQQRTSDFTDVDLVVTSPAVKPTSELLLAAQGAGVPVTTEICLFVERCPSRVFGITGTKGKSTTSAMLGVMLSKAGPCFVGGNIGKSLLAELAQMDERSNVVLELSSYMLHWLGAMHWSPATAVVTMLGLDHVDWHGGADPYMEAKRNISRYQEPGDRLVRRDDELSQSFPLQRGVQLLTYPDDSLPRFDLSMPGEHNQHNAQAAFLAASGAGIDFERAQAAVRNLRGLAHRLEMVYEANGIRFYNDSIATIPEAAIIACDAFELGSVIQIIGGYRKPGLSWDAMCVHLAQRCKAVLTIGELGDQLAARCRAAGGCAVEVSETLEQAVKRAKQLAAPGEVVLLSPGTASYGQFLNFEKRGEAFAQFARGE